MSYLETTQKAEFSVSYLTTTPYKRFDAYRYRIEVTVSAEKCIADNGVVIEFSELKNIIQSTLPDHRYIYCSADKEGQMIADTLRMIGISSVGYNFVISAENLVKHFAATIQQLLHTKYPGCIVEDVKLLENANSYTRWHRSSPV